MTLFSRRQRTNQIHSPACKRLQRHYPKSFGTHAQLVLALNCRTNCARVQKVCHVICNILPIIRIGNRCICAINTSMTCQYAVSMQRARQLHEAYTPALGHPQPTHRTGPRWRRGKKVSELSSESLIAKEAICARTDAVNPFIKPTVDPKTNRSLPNCRNGPLVAKETANSSCRHHTPPTHPCAPNIRNEACASGHDAAFLLSTSIDTGCCCPATVHSVPKSARHNSGHHLMAGAALASANTVSTTRIAACNGVSPCDNKVLQTPDEPFLSCTATWPS